MEWTVTNNSVCVIHIIIPSMTNDCKIIISGLHRTFVINHEYVTSKTHFSKKKFSKYYEYVCHSFRYHVIQTNWNWIVSFFLMEMNWKRMSEKWMCIETFVIKTPTIYKILILEFRNCHLPKTNAPVAERPCLICIPHTSNKLIRMIEPIKRLYIYETFFINADS